MGIVSLNGSDHLRGRNGNGVSFQVFCGPGVVSRSVGHDDLCFCRVSTAVVFGSNVWASSVVEDRIEVTLTCTPPICSAKAPHWLTDATTLIGVVCSFGASGAVG